MIETTALVRYDAMCTAIDNAFEVDEVKDIRDKAMALEAYSRQARNTEAERRACEIRLRAERKAGSLLSGMERTPGRRSDLGTSPHDGARSFTEQLDEHGIGKRQAERWQQLAAVPEEHFERALAAPEKPTTNGIIAARAEPKRPPMDEKALWLWGRLRDFERDGVLSADPKHLLSEMTDAMRADTLRLVPLVTEWLEGLTNDA